MALEPWQQYILDQLEAEHMPAVFTYRRRADKSQVGQLIQQLRNQYEKDQAEKAD